SGGGLGAGRRGRVGESAGGLELASGSEEPMNPARARLPKPSEGVMSPRIEPVWTAPASPIQRQYSRAQRAAGWDTNEPGPIGAAAVDRRPVSWTDRSERPTYG